MFSKEENGLCKYLKSCLLNPLIENPWIWIFLTYLCKFALPISKSWKKLLPHINLQTSFSYHHHWELIFYNSLVFLYVLQKKDIKSLFSRLTLQRCLYSSNLGGALNDGDNNTSICNKGKSIYSHRTKISLYWAKGKQACVNTLNSEIQYSESVS